MTGDEHQAQKVVADSSVVGQLFESFIMTLSATSSGGIEFATAFLLLARSSSRSSFGGSDQSLDCLAVAISHAPGLSGTPDSGHCSRSATISTLQILVHPTSRTMPRQPGDEPRRPRSSDCVDRTMCIGSRTATDHTILIRSAS